MSRTNVYTLIATALLGVLLYVIMQFGEDIDSAVRLEYSESLATTPGSNFRGPTLATLDQLRGFLQERGVEADRALADTALWRRERGFAEGDDMLSIMPAGWSASEYESLDDAALRTLSAAGDLIATQILASNILPGDPFSALDLYETAAAQGSIFALIRIGSMRETFGDTTLDRLTADPGYLKKLDRLRSEAAGGSLSVDAFAYTVAAIRDGGAAIVDIDLLNWLLAKIDTFSPDQQDLACELSAEKFLAYAAARRERGLRPVTTRPPPIFASIPDLVNRLPCRSTAYPIVSLFDLSACSIERIENRRDEPADLYICQN